MLAGTRTGTEDNMRLLRPVRWTVFIAAPLIFGVWSLALGQDANWDLRNYHWYNPYALLHWRFDQDMAPASIQSYLSPLFDIPWYLLAQIATARVVGFTGVATGLAACLQTRLKQRSRLRRDAGSFAKRLARI